MLKKFTLGLVFICLSNLANAEDIFSLKKEYEITVFIESTNQFDIKEGMQAALSSLLINLSGNSKILSEDSVEKIILQSEKFISQYSLGIEDKRITATFVFQGDLIRTSLSQNSLPIWISDSPNVLLFIPCSEISDKRLNVEENIICQRLEEKITNLSNKRKSNITRPLMDFTDLNYFESLSAISMNKFMEKISKRYSLDLWIQCEIEDDFGFLLEEPKCTSSFNDNYFAVDLVFNELIDKSNAKYSLIVNKNVKNQTVISIENVDNFESLESVLEELESQVLIFDLYLREIKGKNIQASLSHFGEIRDLKNLLSINENFKELNLNSQDIISYKYNRN